METRSRSRAAAAAVLVSPGRLASFCLSDSPSWPEALLDLSYVSLPFSYQFLSLSEDTGVQDKSTLERSRITWTQKKTLNLLPFVVFFFVVVI